MNGGAVTSESSVMDLSLRTSSPTLSSAGGDNNNNNGGSVPIVRPVPRPPWSILWYQNIWSMNRELYSEDVSDKSCASGIPNNSNNDEGSNFSSIRFPQTNPNLYHHNLYRLSMAAFSNNNSENLYPVTCRQHEYKRSFFHLNNLKLSHFNCEKATEGSKFVESNFIDDDDIDSEKVVLTTTRSTSASTCHENSIRSIQEQRDNPSILDSHNQNQQATIVLDIACCDGPVQFKRISNPNFALTVEHNEVCAPSEENITTTSVTTSASTSSMAIMMANKRDHSSSLSRSTLTTAATNLTGAANKINSHQLQQPEKESGRNMKMMRSTASSDDEDDDGGNNVTTSGSPAPLLKTYLCIYCNQSFKSLFCYQKHKKRHLNPVSVDITTTMSTSSTSQNRDGTRAGNNSKRAGAGNAAATAFPSARGGGGKHGSNSSLGNTGSSGGGGGSKSSGVGIFPENTKAKTKDLNVQFFPCKKCGCKFPSYYFVHKHRKICH